VLGPIGPGPLPRTLLALCEEGSKLLLRDADPPTEAVVPDLTALNQVIDPTLFEPEPLCHIFRHQEATRPHH